jgi:hypothetical protein
MAISPRAENMKRGPAVQSKAFNEKLNTFKVYSKNRSIK